MDDQVIKFLQNHKSKIFFSDFPKRTREREILREREREMSFKIGDTVKIVGGKRKGGGGVIVAEEGRSLEDG